MLVIIVSMYVGGGSDLLEMTPDEPNHNISGGPNEEFTPPLIGYRKYGKSYTEGGENENERERGWGPNKGCVKTGFHLHSYIVEGGETYWEKRK